MKLSRQYFLLGVFIGVGLLWGIIEFWPDGKMHIVFCDVGQGDATYIKMPQGADILIDGGPNDKVLSCLGRFMPFYDRTIDLVFLTHPQADHFQGLISVLQRYNVNYFVSSDVEATGEEYQKLKQVINKRQVKTKKVFTGDQIKIGESYVSILWPEKNWLAQENTLSGNILSSSTLDTNLFSLLINFKWEKFDLLVTGDMDSNSQTEMFNLSLDRLLPEKIQILKVPHHGSKNSFSDNFIKILQPKLSVISVGKNSFGHPNISTINKLQEWGKVLRTDVNHDIEIISDGNKYWVQ
jgi:competence protein ComEC